MHCFCRQGKKMKGGSCRFNLSDEACIVIGEGANYIAKHEIGRYITKQEAIDIITESHKKGAIHQVFHRKDDLSLPEVTICNCCWDCCYILTAYNRGLSPICIKSYYYAELLDNSSCNGCKKCEKYCPVNAISFKDKTRIDTDKKAQINTEICIGCGQCEIQCSQKAISLKYKEREVILPMIKKSKARIR